jgi:hypothetical protein
MAVYRGDSTFAKGADPVAPGGGVSANYASPAPPDTTVGDLLGDFPDEEGVLTAGPGKPSKVFSRVAEALYGDSEFPDWWEDFHVVPRSFDFGNILSDQSTSVNVFSAFRDATKTWTSWVNGAGDGTTLGSAPSLPATMYPMEGYDVTVDVSTSGTPFVDADLQWVFSGGTVITPIVINRIVLFPVRPEMPFQETLSFETNIIRNIDGTEQRISVRKNPRQRFDLIVRTDNDENMRRRLETLMFDWQARTWGLPMWHESTYLTTAAAINDTVMTVADTANRDFRVNGLAVVYTDEKVFDVQTVTAITATTVTFENPILNNYPVDTLVMPLRQANMKRTIDAKRWPSADQVMNTRFFVQDNDANIGDTSAYNSYNSKVLLDDQKNVIRNSTLNEEYVQDLIFLDSVAGSRYQKSPLASGRKAFSLTLVARDQAELWQVRRLFHALRGKAVSFYIPTFAKDFIVTTDLGSGTATMDVENIGYSNFVRARKPHNLIWVELNDGTTYVREISSASEIDSNSESLTLTTTWPSTISTGDIKRVSYLEEVRLNSDTVQVDYELGFRQFVFTVPVISIY